jgi:hypothetical protein
MPKLERHIRNGARPSVHAAARVQLLTLIAARDVGSCATLKPQIPLVD